MMRPISAALLAAAAVIALALPGCLCPPPIAGQVVQVEDSLEYDVSGPYGFEAALTKEEGQAWVLEGAFSFPTSGYEVVDTDVRIAESYPEQVSVVFTVLRPLPGSVVLQVVEIKPVRIEIPVSDEARFQVFFQTPGCLLAQRLPRLR